MHVIQHIKDSQRFDEPHFNSIKLGSFSFQRTKDAIYVYIYIYIYIYTRIYIHIYSK